MSFEEFLRTGIMKRHPEWFTGEITSLPRIELPRPTPAPKKAVQPPADWDGNEDEVFSRESGYQ